MEGIVLQGELEKRGHVMKNWKERWFILTPTKLAYYQSEPSSWEEAEVRLSQLCMSSPLTCVYVCVCRLC